MVDNRAGAGGNIAMPDLKEGVVELGYNIVMSSPQQFASQIAAEVEK